MVYRPKIDDKLCFVLMPFRDPFNGYYEHIIKKVVKEAGLEPLRGDEIFGIKPIIRDVWEHIWRARLVIADVTDRNPNVNYELGLCHSLGVPTILITQAMEDVPFDYRHRRCIVYNTREATWLEKFSATLESTILAVLRDGTDEQELKWPYDTFALKELSGHPATISLENPRQIVLRGMAELEKLLSKAFGPRGTNVSVTLSSHQVVSHKQGLVIAQGIHSANPIEERGIGLMRGVGHSVSNTVGDGTKTAMILAHALVEGGQLALGQGHPVTEVLRGMDMGVTAAASSIMDHAQACTPESLSAVAMTASGDRELSDLVLRAVHEAGGDGVIVVETKSDSSTDLAVQGGLQFDRGFLSSQFVSNAATEECELRDCFVLVHEPNISSMKDLLPVLEQVAGRSLLIIADNVEGEALAVLLVNHLRGTLHCAAVRTPGTGERRRALLQDIAVLTGARLVTADLGPRLESVRLEDLGAADKVVVTKDNTTIFGGHGSEGEVRAHVDALRVAIGRSHNAHDREKLQERLANLAGKIASVRVGGLTEIDVEERRYRAISAMHSIRAATEKGWSYGGGVALLNAREDLASLAFRTTGEEAGAQVVSKALETPFVALAQSCNKSPVSLLSELQQLTKPCVGLNVETCKLEDMQTAGILDPARVLRAAIEIAFSYARVILKTDIWTVPPEETD